MKYKNKGKKHLQRLQNQQSLIFFVSIILCRKASIETTTISSIFTLTHAHITVQKHTTLVGLIEGPEKHLTAILEKIEILAPDKPA